jgi:hypothetical protein
MKKQNGKILVGSTAVLTLMLIGTACSGGNNNGSEATSSPSASATVASPSASAAPTATASASPSASTSTETKSASGEFQGVSDPHSIEIKVDGKAEAFQIDPATADKISSWDVGTKVSFQYSEITQDVNGQKVKQLTIKVIDKA